MSDILDNENKIPNEDWSNYRIWVIDNIRRLRVEVDGLSSHIQNKVMLKLNDIDNKITALESFSKILDKTFSKSSDILKKVCIQP